MAQSRAFCLTLNNYTVLEQRMLEEHIKEKCVYGIIGKEVGDGGTPHLQCYIYYQRQQKRSMATWERLLGSNRYHIEVARGTPSENKKYCSKEGEFEEFGTLPVSQNDRWAESVALLREGGNVKDVLNAHPQIGVSCFRNLKEIRNEFATERSSNAKTDLYWFYGPPGSGKSMYAKAIDPDYYKKPAGQWWDERYQQQDVVLMDDFRPSKEFPLEELLNLADYGKHTVMIKGGFRVFNSKVIIITSPLGMRETFAHLPWMPEENLAQLDRRISYQCCFPLNAMDTVMLKAKLETSLMTATVVDVIETAPAVETVTQLDDNVN